MADGSLDRAQALVNALMNVEEKPPQPPTLGQRVWQHFPGRSSIADALASPQGQILLGMAPGPKVRIPNPIRAYHGSPHDFDRFDSAHIGKGEGAQAYGHGLYFAEREGVARHYRDTLARSDQEAPFRLLDNVALTKPKDAAGRHAFDALTLADGDVDAAIAATQKDWLNPERRDLALQRLEKWKANGVRKYEPSAHMYEVAIHAEPNQFLDWDKPLSQQPKAVQELFASAGIDYPTADNMGAHLHALGRRYGADFNNRTSGAANAAASKGLAEAGIPGIRYKDQLSRGAEGGTSNYVVFPGNEDLIEIVRKYGIAGLLAAGAVTQNPGDQ